ncbi:MAG TPA: hydroxyisourate hydrolase, partial [Gemmatimonadales bacterium]|nr:hydroxyisourate hydrolase [Gemmatimonadales bacterium]
MSGISTHVLDTSRGRPAANLAVALLRQGGDGEWGVVGRGTTDADGRASALLPEGIRVSVGRYRLVFDTGAWLS